jgi:hypothetical protein
MYAVRRRGFRLWRNSRLRLRLWHNTGLRLWHDVGLRLWRNTGLGLRHDLGLWHWRLNRSYTRCLRRLDRVDAEGLQQGTDCPGEGGRLRLACLTDLLGTLADKFTQCLQFRGGQWRLQACLQQFHLNVSGRTGREVHSECIEQRADKPGIGDFGLEMVGRDVIQHVLDLPVDDTAGR